MFFLLSVLLLIACKTDNNVANTNDVQSGVKPKKKSDLANAQLYNNYHDNPINQDQKDENAIIDYAIAKNLDAIKLPSGLYYVLEEEGTGHILQHGQPFTAHYSGYFFDGKKFDSSFDKGVPLAHRVGGVIPGWNEALTTFKVGSKLKLLVPSRLAYGASGFPGFIPANTPLYFELDILGVG